MKVERGMTMELNLTPSIQTFETNDTTGVIDVIFGTFTAFTPAANTAYYCVVKLVEGTKKLMFTRTVAGSATPSSVTTLADLVIENTQDFTTAVTGTATVYYTAA